MNAFEFGFYSELEKIAALNPFQRMGVKAKQLITGRAVSLGDAAKRAKERVADLYHKNYRNKLDYKGGVWNPVPFASASQTPLGKNELSSGERSTLAYMGSRYKDPSKWQGSGIIKTRPSSGVEPERVGLLEQGDLFRKRTDPAQTGLQKDVYNEVLRRRGGKITDMMKHPNDSIWMGG
jgi:hypothetical protein